MRNLDTFTLSYLEAAFFSSTFEDEDGQTRYLDEEFDWSDISEETLESMVKDCELFQDYYTEFLQSENLKKDLSIDVKEMAGHDFWLTRNGHGAGFWDGDWVDPIGDYLTQASKSFGEYDLYLGDDGKIYGYVSMKAQPEKVEFDSKSKPGI